MRAVPDPVLVLSREGVIRAANRSASEALRLAAGDTAACRLTARVRQPEALENYLKMCARSLDPLPGAFSIQEEGKGERRFRCDGARLNVELEETRTPILLSFRPRDASVDQFSLLTQQVRQLTAEVRKRQEMELALRESEGRFRAMAEMVPQLVWIAQPDGVFSYVNPRWIEYTGAPLEQVRREGWSALLHPDDAAATLAAWDHCMATGEPCEVGFRLRRASDGEYRWFLGRAIAERDAFAQVTRWFGTCTEIHAQKQAEREAVVAVGVRDDFLSMAAHELKTPLTALKLQLHLLGRALERWDKEQRAPLEARLEAAQRQISRLSALTDSLLDVSRIGSGRLTLERQAVDLSRLVRESVERLEPEFSRAGCALSCAIQPDVSGWWDPLRLDQVVVNLLSNAAKYGRGTPVEVLLEARSGHALLTVKDSGIGIPAESLGRIFDKFERAVAPGQFSGLGLGLYIARQIVDAMGGSIGVESRLGAGSTFTVRLPCATSEALSA